MDTKEKSPEAVEMFRQAYECNAHVRNILNIAAAEGKMRVAPRIEEICRDFFELGFVSAEIIHGH
jgi:hypothetical protein